MAGVFLVGAFGYRIIEADRGVTVIDAAYMMVITLSTVGFSEPWPLSPAARLWTMGVIAFGLITISFAFSSLVGLVVSGELRSIRERTKMTKTLNNLDGHMIVCGYGRMGAMAAAELKRRGLDVAVIESRTETSEELRRDGFPFVIGDGTEEEYLVQAGLMRASALLLTLPSDADNVFIAVSVHTLCPNLTIVARATNPATESKLKRAGVSHVVCPQAAGAMKVVNILTRPAVVDFIELADKGLELEIDEYVIRKTSPLVGRTLREADVRIRTGAMVVAIKRADGEAIVNPDPDAGLGTHDTLILVGPIGVSDRLDAIDSVG